MIRKPAEATMNLPPCDPIPTRRWWKVDVRQRNRTAQTFIHAGDETIAGARAAWYLGWSNVDAPITFIATEI